VISETGGKAASLGAQVLPQPRGGRRGPDQNLFSRKQRDGKSPDLTLVPETWGRESCRPGKTKEAAKILGSGGCNFARRQVSHTREHARYFRNIGRLVALAAVRLLARGTESPFQSKPSQVAKLLQHREGSAFSDKLNFPQKKS